MARIEKDRDDFFSEATALQRRVALKIGTRTVVAGTRSSGVLTIFIGQGFVLNFNSDDELRRAYRDGFIYRAESGRRLGQLRRTRSKGKTILHASTLSDGEAAGFIQFVRRELRLLSQAFELRAYLVVDAFPVGQAAAIIGEVNDRIRSILERGVTLSDGM